MTWRWLWATEAGVRGAPRRARRCDCVGPASYSLKPLGPSTIDVFKATAAEEQGEDAAAPRGEDALFDD